MRSGDIAAIVFKALPFILAMTGRTVSGALPATHPTQIFAEMALVPLARTRYSRSRNGAEVLHRFIN
ncbi:hypothetical protein [Chelatococcus composti]|jgi:hypothetical protein|uniref:Uncharacterized protein n=1 Tax=Chelatococcus composti TaxID=1743235 RepID=A0A841K1P7_9HYPH|nr:hypothetical protein [Chelatococcus composti]MBB6166648.1 hypothetical protein [Chelatococcus composti]MBS7734425.1 hypothetical protein [Chelatococcus composti]PZN39113.1 MAG: hypothetical protein DIU59_13690 [Pseudomonadota bacterium]GGG26802.1 hypothetical protein GCM10008026_03880 [Chelatococcus composti]